MSTIEPRDALRALANQIDQWRLGHGMSKSALMRTISGLNDKTFNKILSDDWEGLRPENHLDKYAAAWRECESFASRSSRVECLPELPPTKLVYESLCGLKLNCGNDRFMLILSEGGGGKTEALRYAAAKIAGAVYVCGGVTWMSPRHAAADILRSLGWPKEELPVSFADRTEEIIAELRKRPKLLLLDEYHEAAAPVHNLLKLIINKSDAWASVAAASSIWADNQVKSWAILRQMVHNRMDLRVTLPPPDAASIEDFLAAQFKITAPGEKVPGAGEWDKAFAAIASHARSHGLWAFVRKTGKAAAAIAMAEARKATAADLVGAAAAVLKNTANLSARLNCYIGDETGADAPYLRAV